MPFYPPATALIADSITGSAELHAAFLLPMLAYILICGFAVTAARGARCAYHGDSRGACRLKKGRPLVLSAAPNPFALQKAGHALSRIAGRRG